MTMTERDSCKPLRKHVGRPTGRFKALERGWCFGSDKFREEMLVYIEQQKGKWHYGEELRECMEAKAERIIKESLGAENISEQQLDCLRKGHPTKLLIAQKLRAETTMTVEWIAKRLCMGTRGHLAQLLQEVSTPQALETAQGMLRI